MPGPVRIFVSYAHEDDAFRERLEQILRPLEREFSLECFTDVAIQPGQKWSQKIEAHLRDAHLILLLVSDAFLASEYIQGIEMRLALEENASDSGVIIPIIVRACDWESSAFGAFQALPRHGRPVASWPLEDEAWTDVAKGLREAIGAIAPRTSTRQPVPVIPAGAAVHFLQTQMGSQRTTLLVHSAAMALLVVIGLATTAAAATGTVLLVPPETRAVQLLGGLFVAACSLPLLGAQSRHRERAAALRLLIEQATREQEGGGQMSAQTLGVVQQLLARSLGTLERTAP